MPDTMNDEIKGGDVRPDTSDTEPEESEHEMSLEDHHERLAAHDTLHKSHHDRLTALEGALTGGMSDTHQEEGEGRHYERKEREDRLAKRKRH